MVLDIIKNQIDQFKEISFDFYSAEIYVNHKGDNILLLFTTFNIYLIDLERKEIKIVLKYDEIQSVSLEKDDKIRIYFKNNIGNVRLLIN